MSRVTLLIDALDLFHKGHSTFELLLMGYPDDIIEEALLIYLNEVEQEFAEDNEDDAYGGPH